MLELALHLVKVIKNWVQGRLLIQMRIHLCSLIILRLNGSP